MILRSLVFASLCLATAAQAEPLAWRDATRTLAFDESSSMTLEFLIVDMPNGDQLRLTCQLDKRTGRKVPVFQVLFQNSDAQSAMVLVLMLEDGAANRVDVGPLVYRTLEGIRAPVPEGLLARMRDAAEMRVVITGSEWQEVNQESSAAVLPRLSCFRNN